VASWVRAGAAWVGAVASWVGAGAAWVRAGALRCTTVYWERLFFIFYLQGDKFFEERIDGGIVFVKWLFISELYDI
jgi:hypothetical protein